MLDIDNVPLDDQKTWDMICSGNVKGCFQIESHLGKTWCKKVHPRTIEELAAVISIVRPGMLKAYLDGKSMTQHFADRKNGEEEVPSLHPLIDDIIEPTQGTICYQEQAMQIAQKLAGFSLEDADVLRKCLSGNSLVLTNNGPVKISDLANKRQPGKIWTIDKSGKFIFKNIKRVWSNGSKQTYKVTTEKGFGVSATSNHKIFTNNGWVPVSSLQVGDFVAIARNYTFKGRARNIDADADYQFCKITSIEPDKIEEVFDYEVADEEIHYGFVDGILVHNSMGKKDAGLMSVTLDKFVDGCRNNGVDGVVAKAIAETINASNRYSFNKSVNPSTTVQTSLGETKTIAEIEVGEYIKTPLGYSEVVGKYDHGVLDTYKITLEDGKAIECSINHKFLCSDGTIPPLYEIIAENKQIISDKAQKVIKIEPVGKKHLWDIEIDSDDHIFYGNGIATSNSHAVGYAMESYKSAYLKANYPLVFFCKWLKNADEKIDPNREVKELIVAARNEEIEVFGPTLKIREKNFSIQKNCIYFGLLNVKYVGEREFSKLEALPDTESWIDLLPHLSNINKRSTQALISVGGLSFTGMSRAEMLHELKYYNSLTKKEKEWFEANYDSNLNLADNLDQMLVRKKIQSRRKETLSGLIEGLRQPGRSLHDNPISCVESEEQLLGISLHYSRLDGVDGSSYANATCKEMMDGRDSGNVAVVIKEVKEHTTKNSGQMAFITCEDENELDNVVIFPNQFEEYSDLLYEDNTLILSLEKSKTQNSFIVNRVIQI